MVIEITTVRWANNIVVIILQTAAIEKYSRIGAEPVVTKVIPDYSAAVGVPVIVIKILKHEED